VGLRRLQNGWQSPPRMPPPDEMATDWREPHRPLHACLKSFSLQLSALSPPDEHFASGRLIWRPGKPGADLSCSRTVNRSLTIVIQLTEAASPDASHLPTHKCEAAADRTAAAAFSLGQQPYGSRPHREPAPSPPCVRGQFRLRFLIDRRRRHLRLQRSVSAFLAKKGQLARPMAKDFGSLA